MFPRCLSRVCPADRGETATEANAWNAVGVSDSCVYVPGDASCNGVANGQDVQYMVDYFKGHVPACITCDLAYRNPAQWTNFYAPADWNGSCQTNGVDITFAVNYLKGLEPAILWCLHYTPGAP
jgi:hypothetical protein